MATGAQLRDPIKYPMRGVDAQSVSAQCGKSSIMLPPPFYSTY